MKRTTTMTMIAILCMAVFLPIGASADDAPGALLIYYGYPSGFNHPANGWSLQAVAQDMSQYDMVVLGDGLEMPAHPDHANAAQVISDLDATVFGYVSGTCDAPHFEDSVDNWAAMGADGIFIDRAGYDFRCTRVAMNDEIDYVHEKGMVVFVNAWNSDHIFSVADDPAFPNRLYNPDATETTLSPTDWYLLESCPISEGMFPGGTDRQTTDALSTKVSRLQGVDIHVASVSTIRNDSPRGQLLFDEHYAFAVRNGFDAQGASDIQYGAMSSVVRKWDIPAIEPVPEPTPEPTPVPTPVPTPALTRGISLLNDAGQGITIGDHGYVGINNPNPMYSLDIGGGNAHIRIAGFGNANIELDKGSPTRGGDFLFKIASHTRWVVGCADADILGTGDDFRIGRTASDPCVFIQRATDNVGINTAAPMATLDIAGSLRIQESRTIPTSTSPGIEGEIAMDDEYLCRCIAPDTWVRTSLETW